MKLWLWSAVLTAASLWHRDPSHRALLRGLADELAALDRSPRTPP